MESKDSPSISPFPSDKGSADIIFRTADHVDFYIHKVILSHSSSFFKDMFTLPQSPQNASSRLLQVVPVIEDSSTWEILLRICYPIAKEGNQKLTDIETALKAAKKYDMELPIAVFTGELIAAVQKFPHRVWGIACRAKLEGLARLAAKHLVKSGSKDLRCALRVLAGDYFRLLQYLRCNGEVETTFKLLGTPSGSVVRSVDSTTAEERTQEPFCKTVPYPDVTCRSVDGIEFAAHRCILAVVSPVLRERLAALNEDNESAPLSSSILEFRENGETLRFLLEAFYEHSERIPDLAATMIAAENYKMTRGYAELKTRWDTAVSEHPLAAYFVAAEHGWTDRAKSAAVYHLFAHPLGVYDPAMEEYQMIHFRV